MGWEAMVQCNADRVDKIILIGTDAGKRRFYFEKAVLEAGLCYSFYDWRNFLSMEERENLKRCMVKIDAPEWNSCRLEELESLIGQYMERLSALSRMPFGAFFNHPEDIAELLDKHKCKKRLIENGIPVTRLYDRAFSDPDSLLRFMAENKIPQVFIKPLRGSGAAGVTALRYHRRPDGRVPGRIVLYTCAAVEGGALINTRRMSRLEGAEAAALLERLLKLECIVEQWHPKDSFAGCCYDLRVIVQEGRVDYILPRLSRGPITNLHLNNHSVDFERLPLDAAAKARIFELCVRAAQCYPRLKSIGMDVLLKRGSRNPCIIEMNAQGDLLHRDVASGNRIYRRQVEIMRAAMPQTERTDER